MTSADSLIELLPHRVPMRLVEVIVEIRPGEFARGRRFARPDDWYFQGHFPGDPVVPAIILVELLAQTGGIAACSGDEAHSPALRVAAFAPFNSGATGGVGVASGSLLLFSQGVGAGTYQGNRADQLDVRLNLNKLHSTQRETTGFTVGMPFSIFGSGS